MTWRALTHTYDPTRGELLDCICISGTGHLEILSADECICSLNEFKANLLTSYYSGCASHMEIDSMLIPHTHTYCGVF